MKNYPIILYSLLLLSLSACETLFLEKTDETDPFTIFDEAWTFADQEYSFFSFKQIDWDAVYDRYRGQISKPMEDEALFDVLADMLFELRDGHVNLRAPFDRSRNWEWYLNSPENFNYALLERNYFDREEQFVGALTIKDLGRFGYIYYSSFGRKVEEEDIDYVIERFQDKEGIIFDVRNNGGGSLSNVFRLVNRFTDQQGTVAKVRYKNGPGHEDFTDFFGIEVKPEGPRQFTKKVMLLTNRKCYSATNYFALLMTALPNVTMIGDTTGGGGGAPAYTELANGWQLRVSSSQLLTLDDFNVEDGIPPDIRIDLSPADEARGIDTILERAIIELRK